MGFAAGGFIVGLIVAGFCFAFYPAHPGTQAGNDVGQAASQSSTFRVYLDGEVHRPGVVEIDAGRKVTVTQAIILDGGVGDFGDDHRVTLFRKRPDGTSSMLAVDFRRALNGKAPDPLVQSDDLIQVPQRSENF